MDARIVRRLTYRDMPTATREELMGALEPTATLSQSDVLDQIVRLDGEEREKRADEREQRMLKLTEDMARLTRWAVGLAVAALVVSVAALLATILIP